MRSTLFLPILKKSALLRAILFCPRMIHQPVFSAMIKLGSILKNGKEAKMLRIFAIAALIIAGFSPSIGYAGDPTDPGSIIQDCPTCPKMIVVPAGSFKMGQDEQGGAWEYSNEFPKHLVTIPAPFAIGVYPVTQEEWKAVMGGNPSKFKGDKRPVEQVSWLKTQSFTEKLSKNTNKSYRLPSESEWEYVARAGTKTPYFFSKTTKAPGNLWLLLGKYAWYSANSGSKTHPVGLLLPNPFGLYDIYGNVWEWVQDCYNLSYTGAPNNGEAWTSSGCFNRISRGGAWNATPFWERSAVRNHNTTDYHYYNLGFRVARPLQ